MPRSASSFQRTRGRGPRRAYEWARGPESTAIQGVSSAGTTIWSIGIGALVPLTVTRIRGEFACWLSTVTTVGDGFRNFTLGIGIVSGDAFAIGATAMPTLLDDADWPGWLYYHAGSALIGDSTTEVFRNPMSAVRVPIDTKAMRKMAANETLFGAVEFGTEIGTAVVEFVGSTRLLVKVV